MSTSTFSSTLSLVCLLIVASLLISPAAARVSKKTKECSEREDNRNDANVAKLMSLGEYGRRFPESQKEIKPYCEETTELSDKIDAYKTKCSTGSRKEFSSVIIYSIKRTVRSMCKKRSKRQEKIIRSMVCANKVSNTTSVCYNDFIDAYQGIPKAPKKNQIPHACCEYINLLNCFERELNAEPECLNQTETFLDFVRGIFDDIVNLTCAEYNESNDRCDKLPATPKKESGLKRTKSFMVPLLKVWETADIDKSQSDKH